MSPALGGLAGLPADAVAGQVRSALDVAVHLRRAADGSRQLSALGIFVPAGREMTVQPVWTVEAGALPAADRLRARLLNRHVPVPRLLLPAPSVLLPAPVLSAPSVLPAPGVLP